MSFQTPDINTRKMIAAYDEGMKTETKGFLQSFFGRQPNSITLSNNERIIVDVIRDSQRIAVDVNRGGLGNRNTG